MNEGAFEIRIGTSGWHYKHWKGTFYPEKFPNSRMLEYYIQHFDTVELNNTFYHLPAKDSLATWRETTPPDFRFAVKGSRFLTHMKKLNDAQVGLDRFIDAIAVLETKVEVILFQLPPNWELNLARLRDFLIILPTCYRYAFEFRNATWNTPETYALLTAHNAAYCIYDLAGYLSPLEVTADFAYVRLHGPGGKYQGTYSDESLAQWARHIDAWRRTLAAAYVYFDNDDSGYAAHDALRLKAMVQKTMPQPTAL